MSEKWSADNTFAYPHRDDAYEYRTVAYARSEEDDDPVDVVTVATPASIRDGWDRFTWSIVSRESPLKDVLLVIAGPEVRVEIHNFVPKGSMAPSREGFDVRIVRVQAARFVPQPGEVPRLGTLVGSSVAPVYSHVMRRQDGPMSDSDFAVDPCRLDLARLTREPDSAKATHVHGEWEVTLKCRDVREPGAFDITLEPHPDASQMPAKSAFLVKVAHTANFELVAMQRMSLAERASEITPWQLMLLSAVVQYYAGEDREAKSVVEVERAVLGDSNITVNGLDLDKAEYEPFAASASFSTAETIFIEATLAGVEMIPVVGSVVEFGHLTYAAITGFDLMGRRVTQADLLLMGAFAIIGIVPGLPGSSSLGLYKEAGDTLTKKLSSEGTSLVSMNPGPVPSFAKLLEDTTPRVIKDAMVRVSGDELTAWIRSSTRRPSARLGSKG